ncbi:50S ribosomal protein L1 [archaeon]|nr:50S ribosomal protein L1 [archaeon]
MNKKAILDSVKKLREISKKRKFPQTLDFQLNLHKLDLKKAENRIDIFLQLPHSKGKKPKICALVGKELATKAKIFDKVIPQEEFSQYSKDKKVLKKLAREYDYFIAQANLMAEVGKAFGKALAPIGKMPNPKAGCIVPPVAPLEPLKAKLENMIHIQTKDKPSIKVMAGSESMSDEELTDNIEKIYSAIVHEIPNEKINVKSTIIKFTMSKPVQLTEKGPAISQEVKETKDES